MIFAFVMAGAFIISATYTRNYDFEQHCDRAIVIETS